MEDQLYREIILDHWKYPQNYGLIKNPDFKISGNNPTCGDKMIITGMISKGKLVDVKFTGEGCAISKASASLLTIKIKGMKISKITKFTNINALEALPIKITPARHNCALLFFKTLNKKFV